MKEPNNGPKESLMQQRAMHYCTKDAACKILTEDCKKNTFWYMVRNVSEFQSPSSCHPQFTSTMSSVSVFPCMQNKAHFRKWNEREHDTQIHKCKLGLQLDTI